MDLPCIDLEATGRNIRSLRIANGFRVTDISTLLSLDKQAVYKWEYGKCLPQLENLFALGHLYQLKVEDIVVLKKEEASTSSFPFFCTCSASDNIRLYGHLRNIILDQIFLSFALSADEGFSA